MLFFNDFTKNTFLFLKNNYSFVSKPKESMNSQFEQLNKTLKIEINTQNYKKCLTALENFYNFNDIEMINCLMFTLNNYSNETFFRL